MRLAVLSDVHGNLPALEAVLADLEAGGGADALLMLGDYAAMGAWPGECVTRLRALPAASHIRGNTDRYLFPELRSPLNEPTEAARAEAERQREAVFGWSRERIAAADQAFLRDLAFDRRLALGEHALLAVHASPGSDEVGIAGPTPDAVVVELLSGVSESVVLLGHTHFQFDRVEPSTRRRVVNPGSIGLPLDGDQRAAYALLSVGADGQLDVTLRRVAYDVESAIEALRRAGFPGLAIAEPRLRHARA